MDTKKPKLPKGLSREAASWWREITAEWQLEAHGLKILELAARTWGRLREAQEVLAKEGPTYLDRWGCPHSRPEIAIERDCAATFGRLVRLLGLDLQEAPGARGRPPGIPNRSRDDEGGT